MQVEKQQRSISETLDFDTSVLGKDAPDIYFRLPNPNPRTFSMIPKYDRELKQRRVVKRPETLLNNGYYFERKQKEALEVYVTKLTTISKSGEAKTEITLCDRDGKRKDFGDKAWNFVVSDDPSGEGHPVLICAEADTTKHSQLDPSPIIVGEMSGNRYPYHVIGSSGHFREPNYRKLARFNRLLDEKLAEVPTPDLEKVRKQYAAFRKINAGKAYAFEKYFGKIVAPFSDYEVKPPPEFSEFADIGPVPSLEIREQTVYE